MQIPPAQPNGVLEKWYLACPNRLENIGSSPNIRRKFFNHFLPSTKGETIAISVCTNGSVFVIQMPLMRLQWLKSTLGN